MKRIIFLVIVSGMFSCSTNPESERRDEAISQTTEENINADQGPEMDSTNVTPSVSTTHSNQEEDSDATPGDGSYRYDMAFAEKQGQSLGEKVTVIIKGDSIEVVYEGDGNLNVAKGTVLDKGIIMKHKSGAWIIARNSQDAQLDEIGGCTGGPHVIDFKNKKFWTC